MDWSNPVGSAVQGGLGLIGSALSYKYNKALAAQQNQYNIDMWKMQAEYNSPQAQMQRFSEAGLNPNLIYGQGSNGNMQSAPEQVVPQAPEFSKHMAKLGEMFNVEGLRTMVANRKKAQAEAKEAEINAKREADHYLADQTFGNDYDFDVNTGQFVPRVESPDSVTVYKYPASRYYKLMHLSDNYTKNALLVPRAHYLGRQAALLDPQISMRNYDWQNYEKTFWLDKATLKNPLGLGAGLWHFIRKGIQEGKFPNF